MEEILLHVKLEGTENEAKVNSLTQSIITLQNENKKLAETNKALAKSEGDNSAEIAKNTSQIEANKQVISEGTATRKGLIQTIIAEDNSIKALSIRNSELIRQRNLVSTSTEEGRKKIQQINSEIDSNNVKIRENSSALEKQKINIGNYASALDGVIPGLGGMVSGLQGATGAAKAFIATPLGAIIGALGVVLGGVIGFLSKFESVLDIIEDTVTTVTAVFDSFIQNLDKIGSIIGNVLIGNFAEAATATGLLAEEFGNAANEAMRLLEATRELEDAEMNYRIETAAGVNQMKAYVVASRNKNLSVEESNALLQKASDLENELTDKAVKLAQTRADIEEGKLVASKKAQLEAANLLRQAGQSQADYIQALIGSGLFSPEQLDPLISAYEKVQQEASAGLAFQEKIANQQEALRQKREQAEEKDAERIKKEVELLLLKKTAYESDLTVQSEYQEQSVELTTSFNDRVLAANESFRARDVKNKKEQDKLILAQEQAKQQGLQALQQMALATAFQLAGRSKVLQSGLTLISTYFSAQKAYESQFVPIAEVTSPIRGAIAAALAVVSGLGRVSAINGLSFAAGGGNFLTKGPTLLMVGDNPGGVERVTVEPLSGRGQTKVGPGLIQMAGGGTLTTSSVVREAAQQVSVQTILVLQDFEAAQYAKNQPINQATVL